MWGGGVLWGPAARGPWGNIDDHSCQTDVSALTSLFIFLLIDRRFVDFARIAIDGYSQSRYSTQYSTASLLIFFCSVAILPNTFGGNKTESLEVSRTSNPYEALKVYIAIQGNFVP